MLRPHLADGNERRGLGHAVDVRDRPSELLLDPLDRGGRRRCSSGDDADALRQGRVARRRRIRNRDQHGRRGAHHRDRLRLHQREHRGWIEFAQADVGRSHCRRDPHERPAIGMEHRQGPQVPVVRLHRQMQQRADDVQVGVPVRDHHAFRARRRAAGVIDRDQVAFVDRRRRESRVGGGDDLFVAQPPVALTLERDELFHRRELRTNPVHGVEMIAVRTDDPGARVLDDVGEVVWREAIVDRHDHRADLRHGVERFEHRVRIRRDIGNAIAGRHPEALQRAGPTIAAIEKLLVGEAGQAVDHGLTVSVKPAGSARELQRRQWNFHGAGDSTSRGLRSYPISPVVLFRG